MDDEGKFKSGHIEYIDELIYITSFSVNPFRNKKNFTAKLKDSRLIEATIKAHIEDHGNKIIGNWEDNLGYKGIFSFSKN